MPAMVYMGILPGCLSTGFTALDRTRRKVFGAIFLPAEDCAVGHQQNRIFVHRPRRSRSMLLAIRE
ncbi:hypothetical protein DXM29_12405 [Agrobacterium tumefaciens]|nr:hypothetical protein DXM29_12405 [Agrobacterium tumefaciens]